MSYERLPHEEMLQECQRTCHASTIPISLSAPTRARLLLNQREYQSNPSLRFQYDVSANKQATWTISGLSVEGLYLFAKPAPQCFPATPSFIPWGSSRQNLFIIPRIFYTTTPSPTYLFGRTEGQPLREILTAIKHALARDTHTLHIPNAIDALCIYHLGFTLLGMPSQIVQLEARLFKLVTYRLFDMNTLSFFWDFVTSTTGVYGEWAEAAAAAASAAGEKDNNNNTEKEVLRSSTSPHDTLVSPFSERGILRRFTVMLAAQVAHQQSIPSSSSSSSSNPSSSPSTYPRAIATTTPLLSSTIKTPAGVIVPRIEWQHFLKTSAAKPALLQDLVQRARLEAHVEILERRADGRKKAVRVARWLEENGRVFGEGAGWGDGGMPGVEGLEWYDEVEREKEEGNEVEEWYWDLNSEELAWLDL